MAGHLYRIFDASLKAKQKKQLLQIYNNVAPTLTRYAVPASALGFANEHYQRSKIRWGGSSNSPVEGIAFNMNEYLQIPKYVPEDSRAFYTYQGNGVLGYCIPKLQEELKMLDLLSICIMHQSKKNEQGRRTFDQLAIFVPYTSIKFVDGNSALPYEENDSWMLVDLLAYLIHKRILDPIKPQEIIEETFPLRTRMLASSKEIIQKISAMPEKVDLTKILTYPQWFEVWQKREKPWQEPAFSA